MVSHKINFSIEAGLVDLSGQKVPNFSRPTMTHLERYVDESLQLFPIEAYCPAFYSEDGAFLLEPVGVNLVTWPLVLSKSPWTNGSNVIIQPDESIAPDSSNLADRLTWTSGTGNTQMLRRNFDLEAGTTYTLSAILRLRGGRFATNDAIRITSGVVGSPSVSLSTLNAYPNRYRLLELSFTTNGRQPVVPQNPHEGKNYDITSVGTNTIAITIASSVNANDLVGGQIFFTNITSKGYLITANTATSNNSVTITLSVASLTTEGVTTAASKANIGAAPRQSVTLEIYSESTAALDWGGIQIEERPFRTSTIYQEGEINVRSQTNLTYRSSPIANMKTFGVFCDLKYWRGDGNLFSFGNFKAWIAQSKLYVDAAGTTVASSRALSNDSVRIFAQVSEETSSLSLFVNGVLEARSSLNDFTASLDGQLVFDSEGARAIARFLTTDSLLLDGQPTVGGFAGAEVMELFSNPTLIDSVAISTHAPLLNLPPVTVPAPELPIAKSAITGITTSTNIVTVGDGTGFVINQPVTIWRGDVLILRANVRTVSGTSITLDTTAGIIIGDTLIYGNVDRPGQAAVRFPFDPIDQQIIRAIDTANKRLTVDSTLSFTRARAFITTDLYQDIAEVIIENIDNTNKYIFVNNVTSLAVGQIISQPQNELFIDPQNYFAGLLNQVDNVVVAKKYQNGLIIENRNPVPMTVRPFIRVYL